MIAVLTFLCFLASTQAITACTGQGNMVNGACWLQVTLDGTTTCSAACTNIGLVEDTTNLVNYAGSGAGDSTGCEAVVLAFIIFGTPTINEVTGSGCLNVGLGCFEAAGNYARCTDPLTNGNALANSPTNSRFCACMEAASSGGQDPHFHGINGEHVDIIRDAFSNNKIFSIYCDANTIVNARFSANPDGLLFMTEFFGRFEDVAFELNLGKYPQIYGDYFTEELGENRTKYVTAGGSIEADGSMMIAKFPQVKIVISTASDVQGNVYFDIDLFPEGDAIEGRKASGIVGRTFERAYAEEEFAEYHHFLVKSDPFNVCGGNPEYSH